MFYLLFLLFDFVLISVFFSLAVLDVLLIQQPQHPPSTALLMPPKKQCASSANFHHRNPSAPAAVVQVAQNRTPTFWKLAC